MFCSNCGKKIDENDKFCSHCGHAVVNSVIQDKNLISKKEAIVNNIEKQDISDNKLEQKLFTSPKIFFKFLIISYIDFWLKCSSFKGKTTRREAFGILVSNVVVGVLLFFCAPYETPIVVIYLTAVMFPFFSLFYRRWNDCGFNMKYISFAAKGIFSLWFLSGLFLVCSNLGTDMTIRQTALSFSYLFRVFFLIYFFGNLIITFCISGKKDDTSSIEK